MDNFQNKGSGPNFFPDMKKDISPKHIPLEGLEYLADPKKKSKDVDIPRRVENNSNHTFKISESSDSGSSYSDSSSGSDTESIDRGNNNMNKGNFSFFNKTPNMNETRGMGSVSGSSDEGSETDSSGESSGSGSGSEYTDETDSSIQEREKTYEEIMEEKQELLYQLDRLEKQGYKTARKYTLASNLDDLKSEVNKLKRQRDVEKSIKFYRKGLIAIVSGIEYMNNKFDPLDIKLDGWSESQMENITDYDEVFEELHDKYSESIKIAPELKLLMMVGGSAFMFHMTNTLFKSAAPNINDILKQNPQLARDLQQATMNNMQQNLGQQSNPLFGFMQQSQPQFNRQVPPQQQFNQGAPQQPMRPMRGPQGVDDILRDLNTQNVPMQQTRPVSSMPQQSIPQQQQQQQQSQNRGPITQNEILTPSRRGRRNNPADAININF